MTTFKELGITKYLDRLEEIGLTEPFPIQAEAIPVLLEGKDMIGQAQTGTGKTAAFGLPILEMIDPDTIEPQALIIVPTRELAVQVSEELKKFSRGAARVTPIYGGESMLKQIRLMRTARQILVATPGRLIDYMRDDLIHLKKIRFVVLDEADRMLDMGFIKDIKHILHQLPEGRQMCMFSATMPKEIQALAHDFLNQPKKIIVSKDEISNLNIKQYYMMTSGREKLDQLCGILKKEDKKTIVFCSTKMRVKELAENLYKRGFEIDAIQGDMEQGQRNRVIRDFKNHKSNILIATDVVARGIDVPYVDRVISFDVPAEKMAYFHRIGRTARAGKEGVAIIFVTRDYINDFKSIRRETKVQIEELKMFPKESFPIVRESDGRRFGGSIRFRPGRGNSGRGGSSGGRGGGRRFGGRSSGRGGSTSGGRRFGGGRSGARRPGSRDKGQSFGGRSSRDSKFKKKKDSGRSSSNRHGITRGR